MPVLCRPCLVVLACAGLASAGDASPAPAPQPQPQPPQVRMLPGRNMVTAFEVETLAYTPGDQASLAAWAELAIRGYHMVATAVVEGKTVLFFERNLPPAVNTSELALPAAVETDPAKAAALRSKLLGILAERRVATRPGGEPVFKSMPAILEADPPKAGPTK